MGTKFIMSGICLAGLFGPATFAEPPAPARARTAARRVAIPRGSSYLGIAVILLCCSKYAAIAPSPATVAPAHGVRAAE